MKYEFKGKVALVTGASRGIGAAIAKRLAQEGANVAISYSTSKEKAEAVVIELEQNGIQAAAFKADQGDMGQVEDLIKAAVKRFGRLDILVANAGIFVGGAIDDPSIDVSALMRQYAINVTGVITAVRTAVKYMGEGSRIILIGSTNGTRVPFSAMADYSGTKTALIGYARGWARDLGPRNITVNVIQPGPIDTDMNQEDGELAKLLKPNLALGRYGKVEEVAAAVVFIASQEASFITGTILTVDGGLNA